MIINFHIVSSLVALISCLGVGIAYIKKSLLDRLNKHLFTNIPPHNPTILETRKVEPLSGLVPGQLYANGERVDPNHPIIPKKRPQGASLPLIVISPVRVENALGLPSNVAELRETATRVAQIACSEASLITGELGQAAASAVSILQTALSSAANTWESEESVTPITNLPPSPVQPTDELVTSISEDPVVESKKPALANEQFKFEEKGLAPQAERLLTSLLKNPQNYVRIRERYEAITGALFTEDLDFALKAVSINPLLLQYLTEASRNNEDIVLAAVRENPCAFSYAGRRLLKNTDFLDKAGCIIAKQDPIGIFEEYSRYFKSSAKVLLEALKQFQGSVIQFEQLFKNMDNKWKEKEKFKAVYKQAHIRLMRANLLSNDRLLVLDALQALQRPEYDNILQIERIWDELVSPDMKKDASILALYKKLHAKKLTQAICSENKQKVLQAFEALRKLDVSIDRLKSIWKLVQKDLKEDSEVKSAFREILSDRLTAALAGENAAEAIAALKTMQTVPVRPEQIQELWATDVKASLKQNTAVQAAYRAFLQAKGVAI